MFLWYHLPPELTCLRFTPGLRWGTTQILPPSWRISEATREACATTKGPAAAAKKVIVSLKNFGAPRFVEVGEIDRFAAVDLEDQGAVEAHLASFLSPKAVVRARWVQPGMEVVRDRDGNQYDCEMLIPFRDTMRMDASRVDATKQ